MIPALEASLKLTEQFREAGKVRVHEWTGPVFVPVQQQGRGGHNRRAVVAEGRTFSTVTEACRRLRVNPSVFYKWLDTGRATYK